MTGGEERSWAVAGPSTIPLKRARTACYPCRYRRNKCEGEPPDPCRTCLTQDRPCEWPAAETRKRRGRKKAVPVRNPTTNEAMDQMPSADLNWEDILQASQRAGQSSNEPALARRLSTLSSDQTFVQAPVPDLPISDSQTPISRLLASISEFNDVQTSSEEQHLSWLFPGLTTNPTPSSNLYPQSPRALASISNFPLDWAAIVAGSTRTEATPPELVSAESLPWQVNAFHGEGNSHENGTYSLQLGWNRSHGSSAVLPGVEKATLRVVLRTEASTQAHDPSLDLHLVELFFTHFGSQFPALRLQRVREVLQAQTQSTPFLVNAMASVSARFSRDPRIALSGRHPWQYGEPYRTTAMSQIGQLMAIPSHETINGLSLLSLSAFGTGSPLEAWMLIGMAVRLSDDMGLHLDNEGDNDRIVAERLTFWSLVMLDYAFCMWEGRKPSIPSTIITRRLPDQADCRRFSQPLERAVDPPRHPFPFLAEAMLSLGPLLESLNSDHIDSDGVDRTLRDTCAHMTRKYDDFSVDVAWNAANLHLHHEAGQGSIYLFLHIFNHAIQSLVQGVDSQRAFTDFAASGKPSRDVVLSLGANLWLHSPRFIGDMLVLAKLTDPRIYISTPFISHCFFLAAKAFVTDERLRAQLASSVDDPSSPSETGEKHKSELFRTLTKHNMRFFQQAISDLSEHWAGVDRVKEQLKRFVENEKDTFPGLSAGRDDAIPTTSQIQLQNIHLADLPPEMTLDAS